MGFRPSPDLAFQRVRSIRKTPLRENTATL
jgi:hypothetical protein